MTIDYSSTVEKWIQSDSESRHSVDETTTRYYSEKCYR